MSRQLVAGGLIVAFTALDAVLLKANPVTGGEPAVVAAIVIALTGNLVLAAVALRWLARYIEAPALAIAATLMAVGSLVIAGAGFAHEDVVFTSSDRQQAAAEISKPLFEQRVPADYRPYIPSATAVKLDRYRFRICVELPEHHDRAYCTVVDAEDPDNARVERFGPGVSNYTVARRMIERQQKKD